MRTLSPDSPRSASPSPSTHKRRKSSCSTDAIDRRPKKGDEDYIKRPENAFILFRRKCCEDRQQAQEEAATAADGPAKKQRQADLSKTISQQWKSLTAEERQYWEGLAKEKKKEHEQMYPNYVYRPQRAKDKDGRTKNKKAKGRHDESESLSFVLPMPARHHGRSASAPTPPPYQSIQIPNIYHMTPSCPTSPSLLPMISRRSAHPSHEEAMSDFDYMPTNSYLPQTFGQVGQFEASLQVMISASAVANQTDVFNSTVVRVPKKYVQHQWPTRSKERTVSTTGAHHAVARFGPSPVSYHFSLLVERLHFVIRSFLAQSRSFHPHLCAYPSAILRI